LYDNDFYKVTGKVLSVSSFEGVEVVGYDDEKKKFKVLYNDGRRKLVPRIYLCFDHEDHKSFIERFC
jgi:hypothetical protein